MSGKHNKCCCGGICYGCCFPWYEFDFPPVGRQVKTLVWEISAPNCATIDGWTGQFSPETTGPHDTYGGCGNCICMVNTEDEGKFIVGTAWYDNEGVCDTTPCGITICFNLHCDKNDPDNNNPNAEQCCKRLKLLMLVFGDILGGEDVPEPYNQYECLDSVVDDKFVSFFSCNGTGASRLLQLSPVTCTCEDTDPEQDFIAIYDLSELSFDDSTYPDGVCEGEYTKCFPNACSFVDATLTVTVL